MPEERIYTVSLRDPESRRKKRTPKAIRRLREFIQRHMKSQYVIIMPELNERVWARGIQKPPPRVRVRAVKRDDGVVEVYPAE